MLKRFPHFFACLLLVLIPLQGIAAANMSICNSMMQSNVDQRNSVDMPCHDMANMTQQTSAKQQNPHYKPICKTICATLCASVSTVTTLPSDIKSIPFLASTTLMSMPHQPYASITLPSLQRPPILLA